MKIITLLIGLSIFFISCQQKKCINSFNIQNPTKYKSYSTFLHFTEKRKVRIGAKGPSPNIYKLADGSTVNGYTMKIFFNSEQKHPLIVGKGSEFMLAGNKYRVLEVFPKFYWIDGIQQNISEAIVLQLIRVPLFCHCENKQLKAFDESANIDSLVLDYKKRFLDKN